MRLETRFSDIGDDPVTLNEAKAFLRVSNTTEDAMITAMITSATDWCEQYTGRSLRDKTVEALFTNLGDQLEVELPFAPIDSIDEVLAVYGDGTETEITSTQYQVIGLNSKFVTFPFIFTTRSLAGYKVTYTTLEECPTPVKDVIKKLISELWAVRSISVEGANMQEPQMLTYYKMLDPYRLKTWF